MEEDSIFIRAISFLFCFLDKWLDVRSPAGHMAITEGMEVSGFPAMPFLLERIDEEMPRTMTRKLYFVSRSRERWMATIFKVAMFS